MDATTDSDALGRLRAALQTIEDMKRTIVCPPELEQQVKDVVEGLALGGVMKVWPMVSCPPGKILIINEQALQL
jgi:hypothetical protein